MKYFDLYKKSLKPEIAVSVEETVENFSPKFTQTFDFCSEASSLLLGNIQSGKTSHMFGILADAADHEFEFFLVLTTDSVLLQKQTFIRAMQNLEGMCICGEADELRFEANQMKKPVVVVLKKNKDVLLKWRQIIENSKYLMGRSIFVIDDESDAASLNTNVNEDTDDRSRINDNINRIRKMASSSFYLQVTATPQSLLLQDEDDGFRPQGVYFFKPGNDYLGGNYFFSDPKSYATELTGENELDELLDQSQSLPEGMLSALLTFFVVASHTMQKKSKESCNFLIHPSVLTRDHEAVAQNIGQALNEVLRALEDGDLTLKGNLKDIWEGLQNTYPELLPFEEAYNFLDEKIKEDQINVFQLNSNTDVEYDFEKGLNIVIGGNTLGRGLTIPNLQITYYCRKAKSPQADTLWQHCRAFGYDRIRGLVRIFLPPTILKTFTQLNEANNSLVKYIEHKGIEGLKLVYPKGIRPTRRNVVDKTKLSIILGGVNYFPSGPAEKNTKIIDDILEGYSEEDEFHIADIETITKLIGLCKTDKKGGWPSQEYINALNSLEEKFLKDPVLIVRRNRDIAKDTGTLLSPNDRQFGDSFSNRVVLTMYRLIGSSSKGWGGEPFWVPNIKFPNEAHFWSL